MKLPVHEQFYTWQGEGIHMGRPAYFIRTFGCPVKCPWCDSAGTWHPDYIPEKVDKFSTEELLEAASATEAEFVVVTGGEPAIHNLSELTSALHDRGLPVHIETSGAFSLKGDFDWITVSPKRWKKPLEENLKGANELKIIVEDVDTIDFWSQEIGVWFDKRPVWLVPEWSQRENADVLKSINIAVKQGKNGFRAGFQLHKLYLVDEESSGVRDHAPLGGNPALGY